MKEDVTSIWYFAQYDVLTVFFTGSYIEPVVALGDATAIFLIVYPWQFDGVTLESFIYK